MAYDSNNVFAKILRGEIPSVKVYEDAKTLAFIDVMPQADQFVGQPCDHVLSPAIQFWGTLWASGAICAIPMFYSGLRGIGPALAMRQSDSGPFVHDRAQHPRAALVLRHASRNSLANLRICIDAGTSEPGHRCK